MNIKKIFIAHSWTDVGINIQTKAVAKKLAETADVVFISQARIGKPEIIVNDHLKVIEWPNKRPNTFKDLLFLIRHLRKEKPDALIVHFGATNICMIASWLMRVRYRICWMHTLSGQYMLDIQKRSAAKIALFLRAQAYRFASHVIVLNEYGRKDAREGFKIKPGKLFKIYNGLQKVEINNRGNALPGSVRFCGRLDNSKGVDILLRAFSKAHKVNKMLRLDIAGSGSEEHNIKRLIEEEHLQDAVKMHGHFSSYPQAVQFISGACCLVVPSRVDNFPAVILEALSNAVPVIASEVGGIPDMMENGKEGILVKAGDVDALATAILNITGDAVLRSLMAEKSKETFEKKFTMRNHVDNVITFMEFIQTQN